MMGTIIGINWAKQEEEEEVGCGGGPLKVGRGLRLRRYELNNYTTPARSLPQFHSCMQLSLLIYIHLST